MEFGTQRLSKHLRWAGYLFLADFLLVWVSFLVGIGVRFGEVSTQKLFEYGTGVAMASFALPSIYYIGGLYSPRFIGQRWFSGYRWILIGLLAALGAVLVVGSIDFSSRVGRGVLFVSMSVLVVAVILRHEAISRRRRRIYDSLLCLVSGESDELVARKLQQFWGEKTKTFGVVCSGGYRLKSSPPAVGSIEELSGRTSSLSVDAILVRDRHFEDPKVAEFLRGLRYGGTAIVPLSDACEDAYHAVPLEIITDSWLFRASNQSQLFYVRKLKRLSDIVLALLFLAILSPFLGLGALLVRIVSPGPVVFRQERAGRFGRPFTLLKLRSMYLENEPAGARWATQEEARILPFGRMIRKFRIDEIPQLVNVLRGEMSFVGPRPEQVAFVDDLSKVLVFYRERLLIHPGITGWAQVNYPYGASVEDAARKLEYDLYYMKHMGLFLDFFILLETVKIILSGGVSADGNGDYLGFRQEMDSFHDETGTGSAPDRKTRNEAKIS